MNKPGHGRGGTAHANVPVGWRKKYLGGLLCLAVATGDTAFVGPPPAGAAARDATPFDFTGAGAVVARSALNANAPAFYLRRAPSRRRAARCPSPARPRGSPPTR